MPSRHRDSVLGAFEADVHYHVAENGCWIWLRSINASGYGQCPAVLGENLAHRASYALAHGSAEEGMHVHHKCEVKACINPDHLELLTPAEHRSLHQRELSPFTWETINEIRAFAQAGGRLLTLIERYGISWGSLCQILDNESWHDPDYKLVGTQRECAECSAAFVTHKSNKRFCQRRCRERWNSRRTTAANYWREKAKGRHEID